jgi:hypothetical protein
MRKNRQNAYNLACYHKIKQRPQYAGRIHSKKEHPFLFLFWVSKKEKAPFVIYDNSISDNDKMLLFYTAFLMRVYNLCHYQIRKTFPI